MRSINFRYAALNVMIHPSRLFIMFSRQNVVWVCAAVFGMGSFTPGKASDAQQALIKELFLNRNYDALSRPAVDKDNPSQPVMIKFNLTLNILVFVSDQDQVMKTNGYLDLNWVDKRLEWDPAKYGGIQVIRLPVDKVWQPDIALTNTVPPFIFKSGCDTDPYYFPFDRQLCNMVFRSVTYNAAEVDFDIHPIMILKDYSVQPSGSWDVIDVPISKKYRTEQRSHGSVPVVSIQLDLTVARKFQFYVVTFLLPCVCIAGLTVFIFFLPIPSGEKLCVSLSILFSIVVFLLILIEVLPPSASLPLMTKFLFFTFVCCLVSALMTTITVNWSFRTSKTHTMPHWINAVFVEFLPKYLRTQRPKKPAKKKLFQNVPLRSSLKSAEADSRQKGTVRFIGKESLEELTNHDELAQESALTPSRIPSLKDIMGRKSAFSVSIDSNRSAVLAELHNLGDYLSHFPGYFSALANVAYIAKNMEEQDEENDVVDDWKYIALVADRLLLWIFLIGIAAGSVSILMDSPYLFEPLPDPQAPK